MILEDHTILKNENYQPLDEDSEALINQIIDEKLESIGFMKYEVSNYSKKGFESLHNLVYWQYDNYYGIGLGASSKMDNCIMNIIVI